IRYCPSPSVTAVRTFSMSAGLAASTVTPGSTAPVVSLTTPAMLAAWCAEIRGLDSVSRVAEARHQLDEDRPDFLRIVAALARNIGKTVSGKRRDDDIERILRPATVAR